MIEKKIMYFDKRPPQIEKCFIQTALPDIDLCFYEPSYGKQGKLEEAEVLICNSRGVKKDIIDRAPNLKMVSIAGIGYDAHDIEYAKEKGIYICNCNGGASDTVAEFDIGLMIDLSRRITQLSNEVRQGSWNNWKYRDETHTLSGKTLGVIGAGGIGKALLRKSKAFNMRGIYYDLFRMDEQMEKDLDVEYMEMNELLKEADYVALLVPLLPSTRHILGKVQFALMKKNAIVLNDSRGECIDQDALVEALRSKQIWGAALDVVTPEPLPPDAPILNIPDSNVLITPHLGSATVELMNGLFREACDNAISFLSGERPKNIVNGL